MTVTVLDVDKADTASVVLETVETGDIHFRCWDGDIIPMLAEHAAASGDLRVAARITIDGADTSVWLTTAGCAQAERDYLRYSERAES
ncbi:MAG: hypothetical protein GY929_23370 [Actinomycetia bacterium]|nr:hypothetical protein [Actinomycetes bacterium]